MVKYISIVVTVLAAVPLAFADTYSENPDKDTWIWPGMGPYGNSTELRTNRVSVHDQEIVMHFDLSSIPSDSVINSATLYAYNYDEWGGSLTGEIYRVTEDWDEYTLVDSIAHDSANPYDSSPLEGSGSYKDFDVTDLVQEWIDGTYDNYGVVFYGIDGTGYYIRFYSREATSNKPYLEVDYTPLQLPEPFSLLTPEDGAIIDVFAKGRSDGPEFNAKAVPVKGEAVTVYNRTNDPVDVEVDFTWEESVYADEYEILVDDNDDFSSPEVDETGLVDEAYTHTFTVDETITYYWRVIASNADGDTTCNEDFDFTFNYNNTNVAPISIGGVKATFR